MEIYIKNNDHECPVCKKFVSGTNKDILCLHCRIQYMANYVQDLPDHIKRTLNVKELNNKEE